jgi:hypothetical protein
MHLYQNAIASIKRTWELRFPFVLQSGSHIARDEETWRELSTIVENGLAKGQTAIIVRVVKEEKQ